MYTVHHKLEVGLHWVEACQVSLLGIGGPHLTIGISHRGAVPCTESIEHLYLVRVTHEVPLQVLGDREHTVLYGAVVYLVIRCGVVINKLSCRLIPYLLLWDPDTGVLVLLPLKVTRLYARCSLVVVEGMMRLVVTLFVSVREVHEIYMVVAGEHCLKLCLRRCRLQEDVTRHLVAGIDTLCTEWSWLTATMRLRGISPHRLTILIEEQVTLCVGSLCGSRIRSFSNNVVTTHSGEDVLVEGVVTEGTAHIERQGLWVAHVDDVASLEHALRGGEVEFGDTCRHSSQYVRLVLCRSSLVLSHLIVTTDDEHHILILHRFVAQQADGL